MVGGHYFDVLDTSFSLQPGADGLTTRLMTQVHYRISTQFNFYADWVAQLLLGNLSEVGLRLYKTRSEQATIPPHPTGSSATVDGDKATHRWPC